MEVCRVVLSVTRSHVGLVANKAELTQRLLPTALITLNDGITKDVLKLCWNLTITDREHVRFLYKVTNLGAILGTESQWLI